MYQFSRAIYRKLAPQVLPPPPGVPMTRNHAAVLQACEDVVTRLALDRHNFARPVTSQTRAVESLLPEAKRRPSGENATAVTSPSWPRN